MDGVGSKSRSVGQILVKSCYHSRGHIFYQTFNKLTQDVKLDDPLDKFQYGFGQIQK